MNIIIQYKHGKRFITPKPETTQIVNSVIAAANVFLAQYADDLVVIIEYGKNSTGYLGLMSNENARRAVIYNGKRAITVRAHLTRHDGDMNEFALTLAHELGHVIQYKEYGLQAFANMSYYDCEREAQEYAGLLCNCPTPPISESWAQKLKRADKQRGTPAKRYVS